MKYLLIYWGNLHQVVELHADTGITAETLTQWMESANGFIRNHQGPALYYLMQRHD